MRTRTSGTLSRSTPATFAFCLVTGAAALAEGSLSATAACREGALVVGVSSALAKGLDRDIAAICSTDGRDAFAARLMILTLSRAGPVTVVVDSTITTGNVLTGKREVRIAVCLLEEADLGNTLPARRLLWHELGHQASADYYGDDYSDASEAAALLLENRFRVLNGLSRRKDHHDRDVTLPHACERRTTG